MCPATQQAVQRLLIEMAEPSDEGPVASKPRLEIRTDLCLGLGGQHLASGATGTPSPLAASSARR